MRIKNFILISIILIALLPKTIKAEEIEEFNNKNHLGLSASNIMLKGSFSRDLNKSFEIGLNGYYGLLGAYNFIIRNFMFHPADVDLGFNIELDLKNYLNRTKSNNGLYIKYFLGTPIFKSVRGEVDPIIYGKTSSFYLGSGIGTRLGQDKFSFNIEFDLGLNTDITYNSVAFIIFPRFSSGVEINF